MDRQSYVNMPRVSIYRVEDAGPIVQCADPEGAATTAFQRVGQNLSFSGSPRVDQNPLWISEYFINCFSHVKKVLIWLIQATIWFQTLQWRRSYGAKWRLCYHCMKKSRFGEDCAYSAMFQNVLFLPWVMLGQVSSIRIGTFAYTSNVGPTMSWTQLI